MGFADLVARADAAVLGHLGSVPVTYAPEVGDPVVVSGVFDDNFELQVEPNTAGVENYALSVWLSAAEVAKLPEDPRSGSANPTLTIGGQNYTIRERPYDSFGGVRLLLHESF
jgi:hypothetical protein